MTLDTIPWDITEYIKSPERQIGYLEAALEDGDPALIAAALGDIARLRGMTAVAREAAVSREGLDNALGPEGDPRFSTIMSIFKALGLKLSVAASKAA